MKELVRIREIARMQKLEMWRNRKMNERAGKEVEALERKGKSR